MKKIIILSLLVFLTGCGDLSNTPIKRTESFFKEYQSYSDSVKEDLESTTLEDYSLNNEQKDRYIEIFEKHYKSLKYEIKDESLEGDEAVVTVDIEVTDFNKVLNEASANLESNKDLFLDSEGDFDEVKYIDYKLDLMEKADSTVKYTIYLPLVKEGNEWKIDVISQSTYNKINGVYNY